MKSDSEKKFEYFYHAIRKGITNYFRRNKLTHLSYEDKFHDVITVEKLEEKISKYDKDKSEGKTLEQWVIFTFIREVLSKLRTEMNRGKLNTPIDFSDAFEENKMYQAIEKNIEFFPYENDIIPVFVPDFMTTKQMENNLLKAKELAGKKIEFNVTRVNIQNLKRIAWTSSKLITEENFSEFMPKDFGGLDTPLNYNFSDPMSVIKIKCWVACSKIE